MNAIIHSKMASGVSVGDQIQRDCFDIWTQKHRLTEFGKPIDQSIEDYWMRIAKGLAAAEKNPADHINTFYAALEDFKFLPAGRVASNAGVDRKATMFNCFVMGDIPDDMEGIMNSLTEAALTMQKGGGIGYDFSTLRPKGAPVKGVGAFASGPLSFMDMWDAMCRTLMSAGSRRGAMMTVMRCDHPDIEDFITAKSGNQGYGAKGNRLEMFNMSVLVTDAFMAAVRNDEPWDLKFNGQIYKTIKAKDLWEKIMHNTYSYAEPGVLFIDRANRLNNLYYCEDLHGSNPCGEQILPPYGLCLLGSNNFSRFIANPFEEGADIDPVEFSKNVRTSIRMLDNVFDVSNYPLPMHKEEALSKRRIGLGITGLANALMMVGLRYGSPEAVEWTKKWMALMRREAYLASIDLAKEKGAFPLFNKDKFLAGENVQSLDEDVKQLIAEHGIRNALLTSIAPTGTISLVADNTSGGIEPVFSLDLTRKVRNEDGTHRVVGLMDYAYRVFRQKFGEDAPIPAHFVTAMGEGEISPAEHIRMQAAAQRYIDNSISKTVNVPENISFEDFKSVYQMAYDEGCKGCTTYRPNDTTGSVLSTTEDSKPKEVATPEPAPAPATLDLLPRPIELPGRTYKIKMSNMDAALYLTINDAIVDGKVRPWEIFINSTNMDCYPWIAVTTRMTSAVFRRGGDVSFVVDEFKSVKDTAGGGFYLAPGATKPRYFHSVPEAIGTALEYHLIKLGCISVEDAFASAMQDAREENHQHSPAAQRPQGAKCPKCHSYSLVKREGCDSCTECQYSKCG